jgi:peptidyl-prolyl cis-trans isomerase SurA
MRGTCEFSRGTTGKMMRICKPALAAAAIIMLAGLAGAAQAQSQPALREGVVAIVNDNIISSYDVAQRIRFIIATSGVQVTDQNKAQLEQEALNELIDERLELQEVRRAEKDQAKQGATQQIVATDAEVDERIGEISTENFHMSGQQFLDALSNAGIDKSTLRDQIRAQMSWERWIGGRYGGSRMKISQAQVNGAIAAREAAAAQPQYLLGVIYLDAATAGGMQNAESGATQLVTQLQQGAPFAQVARQFSNDSTAATGGDAGWMTAGSLPVEVRPVVDQLRPGELSKPIPTSNGVYIILMRDKHAGATSQLVSLKQAAISLGADASASDVAAAEAKLIALKSEIRGCDGLEARASRVPGVVAGDLGEADVKDLKAEFRDAALNLGVGQVSNPIRTDAGLHLLIICGRRQAGVDMPSRDDVEQRLREEELTLISKRQLRDLRNSATIEFP